MKRKHTIRTTLFFILMLFCLAGLIWLNANILPKIQIEDAFINAWHAGNQWLRAGSNPYQTTVLKNIQLVSTLNTAGYHVANIDQNIYTSWVFDLMLYFPFSLIDFSLARIIWVTLSQICVIASVLLALNISGLKVGGWVKFCLVLVFCAWYPSVISFVSGSQAPFIVLCLLGAVQLMLKQKDRAVGFLLALCVSNFAHTAVVILFVLIWALATGRMQVVAAFFAGVAFLVAVSWILFPNWFLQWLGIYFQLGIPDTYQTVFMLAAAALPGIKVALIWVSHIGAGLMLLIEWFGIGSPIRKVVLWKVVMTLMLAFLISLQADLRYLALVLPALFLLYRFVIERWKLLGHGVMIVVSLFIAGFGWLKFISQGAFLLYNQVSILFIIPMIILAGLYYMRWWAYRLPKPLFE